MKRLALALLTLSSLPAVVPAVAQGVPRRAPRSSTAPRLMVANPFIYAGADSAAAVAVGSTTRQRMPDVVGGDYTVVSRDQMNEALIQYGYPTDAILSPPLATTLAKNIQARTIVTSTIAKGADGNFVVTGRVSGVSDPAGQAVTVTQQPGERLGDLGVRVAEALKPAIKSLADAKACADERESNPDKAIKAAEKAIKKLPNYGLAHVCLYEIARVRKAPVADRIKHLEMAVEGDPLSVPTWRALSAEYREAGDTAKSLTAAKQLLRLAPTDQELRQSIFRLFLTSGQPRLALEVAEEGLKVDPENPEMYDLKANACLFLEDYPCAVAALETMYANDSTTADSLFFARIVSAAGEGAKPDTARLVQWAQKGSAKFPENLVLLSYLNRGYVWTGQVDSSLAATKRLLALDTGAVVPALAAVQLLAQHQPDSLAKATPQIEFVKARGDATEKNQLAAILVPVASARLQGDSAAGKPRDLAGAVEVAQQVIAIADSASEPARYGQVILGTARLQQVGEIDPQTEKQKSCDLAKQEQQYLDEAKAALTAASGSENLKARTVQYLGFADQYTPRVKAMLKAYCK